MAISPKTNSILWGRSRHRCGFPSCPQQATAEIEDSETGDIRVVPVLERAHIRSKSIDGPRYDPAYPADKLDEYENLILLCPTHHQLVDAESGAGFDAETLVQMRTDHEAHHDRMEALEQTLTAYLGEQFGVDDKVLFEQAQLRGPSVDAMFVDVPFTCRTDSPVAGLLTEIATAHPGDLDASNRGDGQPVTGAAQALLSDGWMSNGLLVGGPGQGKSTLLQYVCQFHRARLLQRETYAGRAQDIDVSGATVRYPVRIDLRQYAAWARSSVGGPGRGRGGRRRKVSGSRAWPTIEEYIVREITERAASGSPFEVRDLGTMVSTRPVLIALDGLDEVADLTERERVSEYVVALSDRLRASALDLIVLVATRPGGTTPQLWSSSEFPRLDLLPLSHGLRLQYLQRWCAVAGLPEEVIENLQKEFMSNEHLPHIKELASYPMQLAILLNLLYKRQMMPEKRTELYDEYFKTFLDREETQGKEPLLATERPLIEAVHAYLGWYIHTETESGRAAGAIKRSVLKSELRRYLSDREDGLKLADKLFNSFTTRVLCLIEREHDSFQFEVQPLREYFAAVHLFEEVDRAKRDDCLAAMLERPYWANVLRFFVGKYSAGEVRGIKNLFEDCNARPPLVGSPLPRATAAQLLADRAYHGQTESAVRDIVAFILDDTGVVFAEDGLLDTTGGPLVFSDRAGRAQAVTYLKARLASAPGSESAQLVAASLARHAMVDDDLARWAFTAFTDDRHWLELGATLGALSPTASSTSGLTDTKFISEVETRLPEAMAQYRSEVTWASSLIDRGGYAGNADPIVAAVLADLNDGAIEHLGRRPRSRTTAQRLASMALATQQPETSGKTGSRSARRRARVRSGAAEYSRISTACAGLAAAPSPVDVRDWADRLNAIGDIWGAGWILHRAVGSAPLSLDLADTAARMNVPAAHAAAEDHHARRSKRGDTTWWSELIAAASPDKSEEQATKALLAVDLLNYAHASVVANVAEDLNALLDSLSPRHYSASYAALARGQSRFAGRKLFIGDALRRNPARLRPRALWLTRLVASESSLEQIDKALVHFGEQAATAVGATDLRSPVRHVGRLMRLKLSTLRGRRDALPLGGWASDISPPALRKGDAGAILGAPVEWPGDIVQLAYQRASVEAQGKLKSLHEHSLDHEWFPSDFT